MDHVSSSYCCRVLTNSGVLLPPSFLSGSSTLSVSSPVLEDSYIVHGVLDELLRCRTRLDGLSSFFPRKFIRASRVLVWNMFRESGGRCWHQPSQKAVLPLFTSQRASDVLKRNRRWRQHTRTRQTLRASVGQETDKRATWPGVTFKRSYVAVQPFGSVRFMAERIVATIELSVSPRGC